MGIMDGIGKSFSTASKKVAKAYDYKRLNMKIKAYEKEIDLFYKKAGRVLYESWSTGKNSDNDKLSDYMENIANLYFRIKQLHKNISVMKTEESADAESKESGNYVKLSKKDNDLKISRTAEGIKILRDCPSCKTPNNSKAEACENCGHVFNA